MTSGEGNEYDEYNNFDDQLQLTRRGGQHLGIGASSGNQMSPLDINPEEAAKIEETIRHAEQAKRNVRRYKREAEQRQRLRADQELLQAAIVKVR